ncbi:MAG: FtsX-like permease family protein, partial [bacterium]|nr:FtsX-like permease family protein [bacterium]
MRLSQDISYALRTFAKNPGMVVVVVLSIALGIAANTTVFSMANATILGGLPVPDADRLVAFDEGMSKPYPDFADYRDQTDVFEGLSARFPLVPASLGGGEPERVWGQLVTANYFDVLGLRPVLGRGFLEEESVASGNKPAVVVISDGLWRRRFGADPEVVGTGAILNDREYIVVGVAPPGFYGEDRGLVGEFWAPLAIAAEIMSDLEDEARFDQRGSNWLALTGRLKPGVSREQATAAVNVVKDRINTEFGKDGEMRDPIRLTPAGGLPGGARGFALGLMVVLMVVVGLVLLIACANVANILLARAAGRQREIGIRLAVGATRGRLIRQMLTESTLLAIIASGGGILLAYVATRLISQARLPIPIPISFDFAPDSHVLLFTAALTLLTGILFGLAPAFRATCADVVTSLKGGGGSLSRL